MRLLPPISPTDACCTVLAQGCGPPSFEKEIAAVTGHTALKEVARYTGVWRIQTQSALIVANATHPQTKRFEGRKALVRPH